MTRPSLAVSVLACVLAVARPSTAPQAPATPAAPTATAPANPAPQAQGGTAPQAQGGTAPQAVLDRYCVTCHSERTRAGGLALEKRSVTDAASDPQTWEKVIRKVETGMMPPSGAPRPNRASLDGLATAAAQSIDRAAAGAPNPGAPALHRLN